jgi:hypothetical protein
LEVTGLRKLSKSQKFVAQRFICHFSSLLMTVNKPFHHETNGQRAVSITDRNLKIMAMAILVTTKLQLG